MIIMSKYFLAIILIFLESDTNFKASVRASVVREEEKDTCCEVSCFVLQKSNLTSPCPSLIS